MLDSDVVFLSEEHIYIVHREALRFGGGADGVRDRGQVSAAAMAPRNAYYETLADLASVYLVQNEPGPTPNAPIIASPSLVETTFGNPRAFALSSSFAS